MPIKSGVLLAAAPFADSPEHVIDVHDAITIDVGGAVLVWNTVAPGVDHDEHIVDIDETVAVGVGAFAFIQDAIAVLIKIFIEDDFNKVRDTILIAVGLAFIWYAIGIEVVAQPAFDVAWIPDSIVVAIKGWVICYITDIRNTIQVAVIAESSCYVT